jgi:hypothetical protein
MSRWSAFVGVAILGVLGMVISMTSAGEKGNKTSPVFQEEGKEKGKERQPGRGGFQPGRGGFGGFQVGQVMPSFLAERLNLTEEQKKELEVLQTEVTAKINKILNEEQKKQIEEMRTRFGRPGEGRGRPGEGRGRPGEGRGRPGGERGKDGDRPARPPIN